jgi:hypothetical protein
VEELVASRRRGWLGLILVVAFGLLMIAALVPAPSKALRLDQAAADETVPDTSAIAARGIALVTPTTAPAPTTTVTVAPTTTVTTAAPVTTTTTTAAPKRPVTVATTAPVALTASAPPAIGVSDAAFLACIRQRESHGNYQTVSASGDYRGAYQFDRGAWDSTAFYAGRPDLVGQLANLVSPADQDALALALYHWQGSAPWGGACD